MAKLEAVLQGFSLASNQGSISFCGVTLVQGTKNILVDVAHNGRRRVLLEKLAQRGLTPNDIDCLFLTHAHWDHMLNIDLFPNAKILIHPAEREYIKHPHAGDWATPHYATQILESRQLQEVREGDELDDGVKVLETPGHSRGSMALTVRSDAGTAIVTGDAVADGWSATKVLPKLVFWDEDEAKASIRKILDHGQAFYPGHDRPFRITDSGSVAYLEPTSIHVFGWPEAGEGEGGPGMTYGPEVPRQSQVVQEPHAHG